MGVKTTSILPFGMRDVKRIGTNKLIFLVYSTICANIRLTMLAGRAWEFVNVAAITSEEE